MIKKIALLSCIPLLVACSPHKDPEMLKIICPTGAPALAFFDEGNNPNFVTNSTPTLVAAELQKNEYDVVVFDAVNGLKSIKKNEGNYQLAKVITGGNFYLACINKEADSSGNYPLPAPEDKVVSFGEGLLPDLVYKKLAADKWSITNTPTYVNSVSDAQTVLMEGQYGGASVDYVFIAEPALTAAMSTATASTYGKVNIVKNIRAEWKELTGQDGLVQAGVFINKDTLKNNEIRVTELMNQLKGRIEIAINQPEQAAASLDVFGNADEQKTKFGFASPIVKKVQAGGKNGFGLVSFNETIDVNTFLTSLGQPTFEDSYFVNISI